MKLVHLTPELPFFPGGSGGSARQFHLLRGLVRRGHDVTVVAVATPQQTDRLHLLKEAGIHYAVLRRPPSRITETLRAHVQQPALGAAALIRPVLAWQVSVFWSALRPLALRTIERLCPDVVNVEHDWAAAWARDLPRELPQTLTLQNVTWSYYEARAQAASGPTRSALRLEAARFARFDRAALTLYDALIAVSESDAAHVNRRLGRRPAVIPNGVATSDLPFAASAPDDPVLLFTGTMRYAPNPQSVRWFLDHAWQRVRDAAPRARLVVVGPDPPVDLQGRHGRDGVEVIGWVERLEPYFTDAAVVIAPMLSGGGTRLKVLEALASGRPLVSTTLGAEGIQVQDGKHLLLADTPHDFADAVIELLAAPERGRRLAREARSLVEQRYDYDSSLAEMLEAVLAGVTA